MLPANLESANKAKRSKQKDRKEQDRYKCTTAK
jgi:hypothetical protein